MGEAGHPGNVHPTLALLADGEGRYDVICSVWPALTLRNGIDPNERICIPIVYVYLK